MQKVSFLQLPECQEERKTIHKPNTKNIKKTVDSNMTGIMTVNLPEDDNEVVWEDNNVSTVGVSSVTHT